MFTTGFHTTGSLTLCPWKWMFGRQDFTFCASEPLYKLRECFVGLSSLPPSNLLKLSQRHHQNLPHKTTTQQPPKQRPVRRRSSCQKWAPKGSAVPTSRLLPMGRWTSWTLKSRENWCFGIHEFPDFFRMGKCTKIWKMNQPQIYQNRKMNFLFFGGIELDLFFELKK